MDLELAFCTAKVRTEVLAQVFQTVMFGLVEVFKKTPDDEKRVAASVYWRMRCLCKYLRNCMDYFLQPLKAKYLFTISTVGENHKYTFVNRTLPNGQRNGLQTYTHKRHQSVETIYYLGGEFLWSTHKDNKTREVTRESRGYRSTWGHQSGEIVREIDTSDVMCRVYGDDVTIKVVGSNWEADESQRSHGYILRLHNHHGEIRYCYRTSTIYNIIGSWLEGVIDKIFDPANKDKLMDNACCLAGIMRWKSVECRLMQN